MSKLPATIKHPEAFKKSTAAGFDGVFDWTWTEGCFGGGNITPMDFDGVVERKGNFIIFETKDEGVPIPDGQRYTLEAAYRLGVFTVIFVYGKSTPSRIEAWCAPGFNEGKKHTQPVSVTLNQARGFVSRWYDYADSHPVADVDVSFLNHRICSLTNERDDALGKVKEAKDLLQRAIKILS